jgi:pyrroline-5-carboxylate reductase
MEGEEKRNLLSLLSILGDVREVPESQLEAYAIITAMGPTYLWFQLYKLLSLAESFGIPRENALEGIVKMSAGAGMMMADCDLTPEAIMDLVAVRPLKDDESMFASAYDARLQPLYAKLKA